MRRIGIALLAVAALCCGLWVTAAEGPPREPGDPRVPEPMSPPESPIPEQPNISTFLAKMGEFYTRQQLEAGVYVGSEFCIACHPGYSPWRETKHAQALRRPLAQYSLVPGKGVVADFDGNGVDDFIQGLDFNQISSVFDRFKPNAPILGVTGGTYTITIGALTLPIVSTQGGTGDWKQRYLVRVPVTGTPDGFSRENYVSPVQYNEVTRQYVLYHPEAWYDDTNAPRFGPNTPVTVVAAENNRTYSKQCVGCHAPPPRAIGQDANGEWRYTAYPAVLFFPDDPGYFDYDHDGIFDLVNVGCESCHGPGSAHILGGGDPSRIVNPEDLSTEEANQVCGQCHSRVKSVPNGTYDWPFRDDIHTPWQPGRGLDLVDFFTDASGRWPDGIHAQQHHQQWLDFLESPKPGFQFHPVRCVECHDPHGYTSNEHLVRDVLVENGIRIPTKVENNSLCLACHAPFGPFSDLSKQMIADFEANRDAIEKVVKGHTNHPWGAERNMGLSRCVTCHMPKIATSAVPYDIRSHVFDAIPPENTLMYQDQGGMPSSCAASCHSPLVNSFGQGLDPDISVWNGRYDRNLANRLRRYFGPGGIWWDTSSDFSVTGENLQGAAAPGTYVSPSDDLED